MPPLPVLSGKDLLKILTRFGFVHIHTKGSHFIFKHPDGRRTTIPVHSNEVIGPGLLNKIIKKDLNISVEEFLKAIK